jgi:hypothetical protein
MPFDMIPWVQGPHSLGSPRVNDVARLQVIVKGQIRNNLSDVPNEIAHIGLLLDLAVNL